MLEPGLTRHSDKFREVHSSVKSILPNPELAALAHGRVYLRVREKLSNPISTPR